MLDFLKELSLLFSGNEEVIVKSEIDVIGLTVADLFEDVVGVCDIK